MHDDPAYETPGEYKKIYENDLEIKGVLDAVDRC